MSVKLILAGFLVAAVEASRYTYACDGECYENCQSNKLTPLLNNQDWFTKEVLRCATHSPDASLKARVELEMKAVRCKSQRRAYVDFPVGMEDFWTVNLNEPVTVTGPREASTVLVGFTNAADPCTAPALDDKWAVMPINNIISPGQNIKYKTMVFDQLSEEGLRRISKVKFYTDFVQGVLPNFLENSWYMCESGCCLESSGCSNSYMRSRVPLDSFITEADNCVAANKGCKFTISRDLERKFAAGEIFPCNESDLAFFLNMTSPIFNPLKKSTVKMSLSPSADRGYKIKAVVATEASPCSQNQDSAWFDINHQSGDDFEVTRVYNKELKNAYGVIRFDKYVPYDMYSMTLPLHYGTLSDTKS